MNSGRPERYWPLALGVFLLLPAHNLADVIGLDVKAAFVLAVLWCLWKMFNAHKLRPSAATLRLTFAVCVLSAIGSLLSGSLHQLTLGVSLASILYLAKGVSYQVTGDACVRALVASSTIVLGGAWVGFFYALAGGSPILTVLNPDGAESYLYLTTFTNAVFGNIIRPAGVFDEPGALVMFIVLVVVINELRRGSWVVSVGLLMGSMITFSLMALLALLAYAFFRAASTKIGAVSLVATSIFLALAWGSLVPTNDVVSEMLFSRLERMEIRGGRLTGDNRSSQVEEFFRVVDAEVTLRGAKVSGDTSESDAHAANPFSIYYRSGIVIWLPYAILLVWLGWRATLGDSIVRFCAVTMLLLLLQRPYIYSVYWALPIWIVIATLQRSSERRIGRGSWISTRRHRIHLSRTRSLSS